jgi:hypothetical protein
MQTMYKFKTKNFVLEWAIEPDYDCDFSFDETGETAEKVRSGEWECFSSRITVTHKATGAVLGEDWLGGSIYANPEDFRDHVGAQGKYGSYFRDMVSSAVSEARKEWAKFAGAIHSTNLKAVS